MPPYVDMTTEQLREAVAAMTAEVERRAAEEAARRAVIDAVEAYAESQQFTTLQAWRALAPEGVEVPDDPEPEPSPDAPEYVKPTGAHDAYNTGDLVTFRGTVYRALRGGVVWSPLEYPQAWEEYR